MGTLPAAETVNGVAAYVFGVGGATACTVCPAGTYQPIDMGYVCLPCKPGTNAVTTGQTACNKCALGYFSATPGLDTVCPQCPANTYTRYSGAEASGAFVASAGSPDYVLCDPGKTSDAEETNCTSCPAGTYTDVPGMPTCIPCPPGHYAVGTANTACSACPAGTSVAWDLKQPYQSWNTTLYPQFTTAACVACPAGYQQPRPGSATCQPCPSGYYAGSYCPPAFAANNANTANCLQCPIGKTSIPGSTSCFNCSGGYFADQQALGQCKACTAGYYQPQGGSSICLPCPAGKYSYKAATACINCPRGTITSKPGLNNCNYCARGQYANASIGASACLLCPSGTWSNHSSATVDFSLTPGQTAQLPPLAPPSVATHLVHTYDGSDFDDEVFNDLDIGPQGYAHSSRDHSLLENSDFMGPNSEVFGSYEFPPLDGLNTSPGWCLGNPSNGLSSGASCDLFNEVDAANLGLRLSSGKRSSASSGQIDSYPEETWGAAGNPAGGDFATVGGLHVNSGWQSRGILEPSASFPMSMPKVKGNSFESNFVAPQRGQGHSQPQWVGSAPFHQTDSSGWKSGNGLNSKNNNLGPVGHQLCLSPLSGISTDMSLDLGVSVEDELLGHDVGEDGAEARLYTDRQWLMTSERTKKQLASREDCISPKASGVKRQATTVARKLMTHPEGNSCQQCGAKTTPVWRAGPAGPKTLCNACGVRYSKIARKK
eukprot:gene30622-35633_t